MENNIAFPIALEFTKGGSPKITDRHGFSIANLSNTVHKHRTPQGEFIVTACNNYQALKEENEEYKKLLEKLREKMQFEDFFTDEFLDIDNLLTKHSK